MNHLARIVDPSAVFQLLCVRIHSPAIVLGAILGYKYLDSDQVHLQVLLVEVFEQLPGTDKGMFGTGIKL